MHCNALLPVGSLVCVQHLENVTEKIPENTVLILLWIPLVLHKTLQYCF